MKIYCSGIGGIGLSAYASLQAAAGHDVFGSDRSDSALLDDLRSQGIVVHPDQSGVNISSDIDLFVYSEAMPTSASERIRARQLNIPEKSYPEALGEISRKHTVIAVCGTHGKSSTTAMAARMLIAAGKDPTVVVGTKLHELNGRNWRKGKSNLFLLEACEYRHSFFSYHPSIILLTNCDGDHFDFYASKDAYKDAFVEFLKHLPDDGIVITHVGDPDAKDVAMRSGRTVVDADLLPMLTLETPGTHMQQNAQLVLALAKALNIAQEEAEISVSSYAGSWRRMEQKGVTVHGVAVIDDYGHHPKEIAVTLAALRSVNPEKRMVCAFQPHTHDRTLKLYDDFTKAFTDADVVLVPNVYDARKEMDTESVDLPAFLEDIAKGSSVTVMNGKSLMETEKLLREEILQPGDILICMGAGDITNLASRMVEIA